MNATPSGTPLVWRIAIGTVVVILATVAWMTRDTIGVRGQAVIGVVCFLGVAAAFSTNLRRVDWRTIVTGLLLQLVLALLILQVPFVYRIFQGIGTGVEQFLQFTKAGSRFVFGDLAEPSKPLSDGSQFVAGGAASVVVKEQYPVQPFWIFVFVALPTVIFVSSFFTILYHLGILQRIVWVFAKLMVLIMGKKGVSGAETLSATANVFMGQTEAPLIIKPYISGMTRSELLAVMIGGMATISGGVMAVYIAMGANAVAILATSVMAAPAGLYLAKLLLPELDIPKTRGKVEMANERPNANVIDAAASGASEGMKLVLNIVAMLIAFIALVAMANYLLGLIDPKWSLQAAFAWLFSPIAMLMGVAADDIGKVGELLGIKLVLNEFVAYTVLTGPFKDMDPRSYALATFALTGFANFASIGIQIGGIGAMAEHRRSDLARLGFLAILGGFLATLINASIAGILM